MPRNVRVDDELWLSALAKARAEGTTLTAVVVSALRSYVTTPSMRAAAPATAVRPLEGAGARASPWHRSPAAPALSSSGDPDDRRMVRAVRRCHGNGLVPVGLSVRKRSFADNRESVNVRTHLHR